MLTRTFLVLSTAALLASCSNQNTNTAQGDNPYGVPQSDPYGTPPPVTGDRGTASAPYQPLPDVGETGTYAPENVPPPPAPVDDIYGGLSPAPTAPAAAPAPAPAPGADAGAGATTVVVSQGDTLWGFSKKYGVSVNAIRAANNMAATDNNVRLGQKLIIPAR
jgi:LysM repeat protein